MMRKVNKTSWLGAIVGLSSVGLVAGSLASPMVAQAKTAKVTWKTVATWSGDSMGDTQPFRVNGQWRVIWSASPGKGGAANFVADVSGNNTDDGMVDMIGNVIGRGGATSYENGGGLYHLNINADEKYKIAVQTLSRWKPKQPSYKWSTVMKLSGNSIQRTRSFRVKAPWRIVCTASPGSIGAGNFAADIEQGGQVVNSFANVTGADKGTDYEYESGTMDLNINGDENYTIEVQQGR